MFLYVCLLLISTQLISLVFFILCILTNTNVKAAEKGNVAVLAFLMRNCENKQYLEKEDHNGETPTVKK